MRISGCIIVRNEQENIETCIHSLKPIVDEVIVVDTGSEDDTVRIAEELGAFVLKHQWEDDFSKARNYALDRAKGDWIIFLDADEYFRQDSVAKVRPAIEKVHSNKGVECIKCEITHIDKDTGRVIGNDEILRIFRNHKKVRFINKIHEEIRNNGQSLKGINVRNELTVMHTGYSASVQKEKARRNLEMLLNNTKDEKAAYYLATTYFILGDHENAYRYAELALTDGEVIERYALAYKMYLIKISVAMAKEPQNEEKICGMMEEANRKFGNHPEVVSIEAAYYAQRKYYGKALEKYLHALDCQVKYGNTFEQNTFPASIHEAYYNIAQILTLMNRETDALEYYFMALQSNKYYSDAFVRMFTLFGSLPEVEVIAFINSLYDVNRENDIGFILSRIADCGRSGIVLYYANKWISTFGHQDDVMIYALAAQKNYPDALKIALNYIKTNKAVYAPLAAALIILGQLFPESEIIKEEIGEEYFNLVSSYAGGNPISGSTAEYVAVFSILLKQANQLEINRYLEINNRPDPEAALRIIDILMDNQKFQQAAARSELAFESAQDKELKAQAAFKAGYCYFKLKQHQESVRWLEQAISDGLSGQEAKEFLQWNLE